MRLVPYPRSRRGAAAPPGPSREQPRLDQAPLPEALPPPLAAKALAGLEFPGPGRSSDLRGQTQELEVQYPGNDSNSEGDYSMAQEKKARADFLEDRLKLARSGEERQPLFDELCRLYADDLQADSIKWAHGRGLKDPTRDGPTALSRSFIILKNKLENLDFEKRSLLYHFKGRIWSELSHIKNERLRSIQRYETLRDDFDHRSTATGPEERLGSKEQLRQGLKSVTSPAQRRILQAGLLKEQEGYSWEEVAQAVGWEGSRESLRTSFARLKKQVRERIHEAESHSTGVASEPR